MHFESNQWFVVVKFNESFHEPILGNDKYEFKSVHILEVGIQISLTNVLIKCIGSKKSTRFSEFDIWAEQLRFTPVVMFGT